MTRPSYFIKAAFNNITRNLALNLVAVGTISLSLLILSAFLLLHVNLQNLVENSTRQLSLTVYLKDGLSDPAIKRLRESLLDLPGVQKAKYIDKNMAMADLKARLGDQGGLLDGLDENPLPSSFELELDPELRARKAVGQLAGKITGQPGVDEVNYAWDWADKLAVFVNFVKVSGLVVGGLLFAATIFIIANTIKLTVMARQEELYIMRLMGATEFFIRTPFVLEGVVQGLTGGLFALLALLLLYGLVISRIELPFGLSLVKLTFLPPFLIGFLVLAGGLIGFLGSVLSLRIKQA
ncbi:MAG: permease-like cell division protein FtsX [Proteobacteria bacterium]|nr:permease-like cell division protein FtsX [Pseudomonadota bacterium]